VSDLLPKSWLSVPVQHWQRLGSKMSCYLLSRMQSHICLPMFRQVPVTEGKEPPCFIRLFNGHMIIHSGKRDEPVNHRYRLYVLRNELPLEAYVWEIPAECQNLRSRASFILVDRENAEVYVWHGAKSSFQMKQRVMEMAGWIVSR